MPHQRLQRQRKISVALFVCLCVCVCVRVHAWFFLLPFKVCAFYSVAGSGSVCVCAQCLGQWCHLVKTQNELQCILNAPIESYVAAERESYASLNNAYCSTIRYLNTILPLKNFSVFSYLRSTLCISMNHLTEHSQDISFSKFRVRLIIVNLHLFIHF